MNNEEISRIYSDILLRSSNKSAINFTLAKYLCNFLPEKRNSLILDAGCGNGSYANFVSRLGYKNVYGIDLFDTIGQTDFPYLKSSIAQVPFANNCFDFIYCLSVIYYLKQPNDGMQEFFRVLKPSGLLLLTAHTKFSLFTLLRIVKRDVLGLQSMKHLAGVSFYSAHRYRQMLEYSGFQVIFQDGYQISFFLYPLYQVFSKLINKVLGFTLPEIRPYITRNSLIGLLKSEICYHSVFYARKVSTEHI